MRYRLVTQTRTEYGHLAGFAEVIAEMEDVPHDYAISVYNEADAVIDKGDALRLEQSRDLVRWDKVKSR